MTENPNPYAAPQTRSQPIAPASAQNSRGLWREGKQLVMHKNAKLPSICVKTGEPAVESVHRKLSWHAPWIAIFILGGLPIYVILAVVMTKRAEVTIPLSQSAYDKRKSWLLMTWLAGLLCIAGIIGGFFLLISEIGDGIGVACLIGGFLGGIICLIVGQITARILKPTKITDTHVWLSGVHESILNQCPTFEA